MSVAKGNIPSADAADSKILFDARAAGKNLFGAKKPKRTNLDLL
jgi:hypothetical protein